MKIAILGTLHKPISKDAMGGTESFTYYLTEGLVKRGNDVTLFAHPESKTSAKLVSDGIVTSEMHIDPFWPNQINSLKSALDHILEEGNFDIVHNNLYETYPAMFLAGLIKKVGTSFVSTVHNDLLTMDDTLKIFEQYEKENFVFVSKFARDNVKAELPNKFFVYNGVSIDDYKPIATPEADYVLWLSRVAEGKGLEDAILASKKAEKIIIFAGLIDSVKNQAFFDNKVKPLIDDERVIYRGAVKGEEKLKLYQNACALLMPVKWDEPFGLVACEAMACGTPVIAYRRGALPELIVDGETGFIVEEGDIDALAGKINEISKIDRSRCRARVEDNFTVEKMVDGYEAVYDRIIKEKE